MSMNINWEPGEELMSLLESAYVHLGKIAVSMNHYDLYEATKQKLPPSIQPVHWRNFLSDGRVAKYIEEEFNTLKGAEFRKVVTSMNGSRSVGQAQIANSLFKMVEETGNKAEGPTFVYCYIPLSSEQEHASNVVKLQVDPFLKEDI